MASAIINNKFLFYQTRTGFDTDMTGGFIQNGSIAFIKDESAIWTHGKFLYCSEEKFSTVVNSLKARLDKIEGDAETEGSMAKAVADLRKELLEEIGANSVMEDGYTTEVEIGGMAKGTDIGGKSATEVFDLILKPEYAPVFTEATCSISCSGHSNNAVEEVGSLTPAASSYTSSGNPAKTTAGSSSLHVKYGGDATDSFAITASTAGATTYGTATTKPGKFTVRATRSYVAGTDVVETNKGTATNKTASNYTTIMANASANSRIDGTNFTIKAVSRTADHTIQYAYRVYASTATAGVLTDQGLKTTVSKVEATLKGGAAGQKFSVPSSYTGVKIEEYNATLNSWTDTTSGWTTSTVTNTLPDGTSKEYTVYNRANVSGEDMKARITATVK